MSDDAAAAGATPRLTAVLTETPPRRTRLSFVPLFCVVGTALALGGLAVCSQAAEAALGSASELVAVYSFTTKPSKKERADNNDNVFFISLVRCVLPS